MIAVEQQQRLGVFLGEIKLGADGGKRVARLAQIGFLVVAIHLSGRGPSRSGVGAGGDAGMPVIPCAAWVPLPAAAPAGFVVGLRRRASRRDRLAVAARLRGPAGVSDKD